MTNHIPVLLKETILNLTKNGGKRFLDCTFGCGGYTREILKNVPESVVYSVDLDAEISKPHVERLKTDFGERFQFFHDNFKNIDKYNWKPFDGVVYDLGVNSLQLDIPERGFTFKEIEKIPLDMRMNRLSKDGYTAADVLNNLSERELIKVFKEGGEESHATKIAKKIIERRKNNLYFYQTKELIDLIKEVYQKKTKKNVCTKAFQSLRIYVNDEMNNLITSLNHVPNLLENKGRLCVVTFHSGEDKIVKKFGKLKSLDYIEPSNEEIEKNPRSRSAKLRVFEKN